MKLLPKRLTKAIKAWLDKKLLSRPHESVLRQVWAQTTRPCIIDKMAKEAPDDKVIQWTIMSSKPNTAGYYRDRFRAVQHKFKYKFFLPLILIGSKVLGKYLVTEIPEAPYNRNILIADDVFEKSLEEWAWLAIRDKADSNYSPSWFKRYMQSFTMVILRIVKRIVITIYNDDTAYRNLGDIIMYNLTIAMNKEYGSKDGKGEHIFFCGKHLNNVEYYKVMGFNTDRFMIRLHGGHYLIDKNNATFIEHLPKDYGKKDIQKI